MAMKKILTIFTITFVLALTFLTWGISDGQNVAVADESISYVYVAPADLENNEFAGQTAVEVKDNSSGETIFYLIESYYYPVVKQMTLGTTYYALRVDGVDAVVISDGSNIIDALPTNATEENALPGNLLLKENITIDIKGYTIDTRDGWTVKLIGVNGDSFFVQASKDVVTVAGLALKDNFMSSDIQYHPVDFAIREGMLNVTPEGEINENEGADKSMILRIVLIVGIAVPAVIIAIMLFKPGRASARTNYDRHAMRTRREEEIDYDRDRSYDRERDYSRRAPYNDRDYRDRDYRRDDHRDSRRDGYRDDYYDSRDSYEDRRYEDRRYDDRRYDDRRRDDRYDDRDYDDRNGRR